MPADPLLGHPEPPGRHRLAGGFGEVAEDPDREGIRNEGGEVPLHLGGVHLGLRQHERDAPVGRVQPVADRLLAQPQHPGDHILLLVGEIVQLDDVALDWRDAWENVSNAVEVAGSGPPVGLTREIVELAEAGPIHIDVGQA